MLANAGQTMDNSRTTYEKTNISTQQYIEDIWGFFFVKDRNVFHRVNTSGNIFTSGARNVFHRVNTSGNIFTSGCATRENITAGVHSMRHS